MRQNLLVSEKRALQQRIYLVELIIYAELMAVGIGKFSNGYRGSASAAWEITSDTDGELGKATGLPWGQLLADAIRSLLRKPSGSPTADLLMMTRCKFLEV